MAYLDHIKACNNAELTHHVGFHVAGKSVGWIRPDRAEALRAFGDVFVGNENTIALPEALDSPESRTEAVGRVMEDLRRQGWFPGWRGELFPVLDHWGAEPLLDIERAVAPVLGVQAFGVHLNGYVRKDDGLYMWIGRRSSDKFICPGMLDNLVAGGQPAGLGLKENLVKEAGEEADIPPDLAGRAVSTSVISYVMENNLGLKPDTLFVYDLELPEEFIPRNTDGELDGFMLWPIDQVASVVRDTFDFKFNCNLVIIDFLIRHGLITARSEPDYEALVEGLYHGSRQG